MKGLHNCKFCNMLNYSGIDCPVCGKKFTDEDDIVVCPDCGAPYHRHCYNENGQCIFNELHEKGESWKAPEILPEDLDKAVVYEIKDKECPECGALNAHSALFCTHCNASLTGAPESHVNRPTPDFKNEPGSTVPFPGAAFGGMPIMMDPMGGVSPTENFTDNITFGEVSKLVQQNTRYYMPIFKRIKLAGRGKFNFLAFLFSGGWLLYRKQYKSGIIISSVMFCLYLAQTLISSLISLPIYERMLNQVGADTLSYSAPTSLQSMAMAEMLVNNPSDLLLILLPFLCSVVMLVIMIIIGARGNRMYMKHCVKVIERAKSESNSAADYDTALLTKGGVNTSVTMILVVLYMLCTYVPIFII